MKLKALNEKLSNKVKSLMALRTKATDEKRDLTAEELVTVKADADECDAIKAEIAKEQENNALMARVNSLTETVSAGAIENEKAVLTGVHERIKDDPTRGFKNTADVLLAVTRSALHLGNDARLIHLGASATGMNAGSGADGAFLFPPQFSTQIYDGMQKEPDNLLAMCDQYNITGESINFPAVAETSRANGSRFGGLQSYWINEAGQITASKPKFRSMELKPQQLAALVYITDKLLQNAANNGNAIDQWVTRAVISEIMFKVNDSIFRGDGVGKPKGILGSACTVSVAKETSQVAATLVKENANKMWQRLHPRFRANSVWLVNADVEPQFDEFNTKIKNVAGTENVGGIGTNIYNGEKNTLKGRPILPTEYCETLGTTGDIMLVNLSAYAVALRNALQTAMSMHIRFDYAEQALRFIFEIDGQSWFESALTPYKGTATLSPFVKLDTRA